MGRFRLLILPLVAGLVLVTGAVSDAFGSWPWPVDGAVIRGFEPPASPYGSGHRGIDIAVAFGTPIHCPAAGVVKFAGPVGGDLFISVDHGNGLVSTYSWLSQIAVRKGETLLQGALLGYTGQGHPGVATPHLHFGVKRDGTYIDPMSVLSAGSVVDLIRLAPLPKDSA